MSREIRLVPLRWEHPRDENGHFIPLFGESFDEALAEWEEGSEKWDQGLRKSTSFDGWVPVCDTITDETYSDWVGRDKPVESKYMPSFEGQEVDHMMLYEITTEGTPRSPGFPSAEELAQWLTDNKVPVWAKETCGYDKWLEIIQEGYSVGNSY